MYQTSSDVPRQAYAELLRSREHERMARRMTHRTSARRRTARRAYGRSVAHALTARLSELATARQAVTPEHQGRQS